MKYRRSILRNLLLRNQRLKGSQSKFRLEFPLVVPGTEPNRPADMASICRVNDADEEKRTGEGVKEYLVEYVGSLSTYRGFGELFY